MAVAGLAEHREISGMVHAHRARALHERLDDDGRDLVRVRGERALHLGEHPPAVGLPAVARLAQVAVGRGHGDHVHQERLVHLLVELDVADRERAERLAVIAVRERDEAPLLRAAEVLPVVKGHLDGDFDGRRAVVRIEATGEACGQQPDERFRQLEDRRVRESREQDVLEPPELFDDRGIDARIRMAEQVDPPGADAVEIAPALEILQPDAFAARDRNERQPLVVLHLRAGMPDDGQVAGGNRGVRGCRRHRKTSVCDWKR